MVCTCFSFSKGPFSGSMGGLVTSNYSEHQWSHKTTQLSSAPGPFQAISYQDLVNGRMSCRSSAAGLLFPFVQFFGGGWFTRNVQKARFLGQCHRLRTGSWGQLFKLKESRVFWICASIVAQPILVLYNHRS